MSVLLQRSTEAVPQMQAEAASLGGDPALASLAALEQGVSLETIRLRTGS
jgi:hypothetical protein